MEDAAEISDTRDSYRKILPFYEKESVSRAHLAFWRGIARKDRQRNILEIGAGLGRITAELSCAAPAVGLDLCLEMLAAAQRRREAHWPVTLLASGPVFTLTRETPRLASRCGERRSEMAPRGSAVASRILFLLETAPPPEPPLIASTTHSQRNKRLDPSAGEAEHGSSVDARPIQAGRVPTTQVCGSISVRSLKRFTTTF
jgi:hypothetical protein